MSDAPFAAEGVMFDLDGTLILSDRQLGQYRLLPGAVELLQELDRRGLPFVALTNGSAYPSEQQAPRLAALGLPIGADRLFTPNSVAIGLFKSRGVKRVLVLGTEGDGLTAEAMEAADTVVTIPMAHGIDSLNVAATAAVAMYALVP